jgi:hypothetical protein
MINGTIGTFSWEEFHDCVGSESRKEKAPLRGAEFTAYVGSQ